MPLGAGERLGPYEIHANLGAGGLGEVYQARDTRLGRDVAIKVSAAEFSERFEREARAIAALNHPNICTLYDVGPNYLVMELVSGPTLTEFIAAARTPDNGRLNAFLTDFPAGSRQLQVTTNGGGRPKFSGDGNALFYVAPASPQTDPPRGAVAERPITLKPLGTSRLPVQLFVQDNGPQRVIVFLFDVARDGRMLTMRRIGGDEPPDGRLILVQNWRAAVGR